MKPSNAPKSAIPIPPPGGPFPSQQLDQIASITLEVSRETAVAKGIFDATCTDWLMANARNRDFGIPLRAKPAPFVPQSVKTGLDTERDSGVVWLWVEEGSPVECPDLPPLRLTPEANHVHIGSHYYGNFWTAADDNTFNETGDIPGKSDDGVMGVWRFVGSPMGKGRGWYEKVSA